MIEQEALKRSGGNAALWFLHCALLEDELRIHSRGREAWENWRWVGKLPQYRIAEASVIVAWQRFAANVLGIPREQQTDAMAINRALILDECLHATNREPHVELDWV